MTVFLCFRLLHSLKTMHGSMEETTSAGMPLSNINASLTVGNAGPLVSSSEFNDSHKRKERVVHAKGAGAHGSFRVTNPEFQRAFCKAEVFRLTGEDVAVFVRFSTVLGERGTGDLVREPRGFAIKFYTLQGNFDMVMNHVPTFFVRDPIKFIDKIHALKRNPISGLSDLNKKWEFFTKNKETMHMVMRLHSPHGIPYSYRHMHGFSGNTFCLSNSEIVAHAVFCRKGNRHLARFACITCSGLKALANEDARSIQSANPDHSNADLYNALEQGIKPKWFFCVQLMTFEEAKQCPFNPLDPTKIWPRLAFPYRRIGILTLTHNPTNYFAEVEQAAFCPAHIVPGIALTADAVLQGRVLSYLDAQMHRLGPNAYQIPINQPLSSVRNKISKRIRDGPMVVDNNERLAIDLGSGSSAESALLMTSSQDAKADREYCEFTWQSAENGPLRVGRHDIEVTDVDYGQVRDFWISEMTPVERNLTVHNLAEELQKVHPNIRSEWVQMCDKVDSDLANAMRQALQPDSTSNLPPLTSPFALYDATVVLPDEVIAKL